MNIRLLGLAILALMLFALPALAHHSFAMFDQGRVVYMTGKVKQFKNVTKFWSQMGMFGQRLVTPLVTVSHGHSFTPDPELYCLLVFLTLRT